MYITTSYNLCSICIRNTKKLKLIPLLFMYTRTCYERCTPGPISHNSNIKIHCIPPGEDIITDEYISHSIQYECHKIVCSMVFSNFH